MHYPTGALTGAAYGLLGGRFPVLMAGRGLLYGAVVWLLTDETVVPALGLAPPPSKTDVAQHGLGMASHLVLGLTLDLARRQINAVILPRQS